MPANVEERIDNMAGALVREVMTPRPVKLPSSATAFEAAKAMRDADVGAVIVTDGDGLRGIVTDRDVVVRAIAEGKDPKKVKLEEICSREITAVSPADPLAAAVRLMRNKAIRRLPVIEGDSTPVGILSIGDLALRMDRSSALADISAAAPNH